jgi:hypothetical protein
MSLDFLARVKANVNSLMWDAPWFITSSLIIIYLICSIVRFYWSSLLPGPVVMGDELTYKTAAESFFRFGDFYKLSYSGFRVVMGNILYQYVISFSFYFGGHYYIGSKAMNAVLISTTIFPAFLIARCFIRGKMPLLAVIMVTLLPANLYANYIMPESLFFPLFLFSFYFIYRSMIWSRLGDSLIGGLCLALLFLVKPHAMALVVAFILVVVILIGFARHLSICRINMVRSMSITISGAIISFFVVTLLIKGRINLSEVFGMYGYYGWNLATKPVEIIGSFKDLLRMITSHLAGFLFLYGVPVVVVMISTSQSFKDKDFKSFVFLLWGSIVFLSFFVMTLKFTVDFREFEHMMRLHGRYYFFVVPFFLIAFIVFLKKVDQSMLGTATFVVISAFVATSLMTVFPLFFPSWGMYVDLPEWTWLNSFFPAYRKLLDPQGWTWWNADDIQLASAVLSVLSLLLGLYYAFSRAKSLYPYILFFLLFSIIGNVGTLRSQIRASNFAWLTIKEPLALIESTIVDREDPVMLIGSESLMRAHLSFWLSHESLHVAVLAPDSTISDDTIPLIIKWVVLLERYYITAHMQLIRSEGLIKIYSFPR